MILTSLKNLELESSLKNLIQQERKILHLVILHIQEIQRRKLFLQKAYPSLFEYLVKEMGYSAGSAQRRIEASRLITDIPEVTQKIESGEINLSQIGEIQRALKQSEKLHGEKVSRDLKSDLIFSVLNESKENTQKICAQMLNIPIQEQQHVKTQADASIRIEFTLSEGQAEKLSQVRNFLAHKNFQAGRSTELADILETCFDFILEKTGHSSPEMTSRKTTAEVMWKTLTPQRRRFIFQRDRCCQFKDSKTGHLCKSRFQLEVDHIQPRWAGGSNDPENLRLLCRNHNQFRYKNGS